MPELELCCECDQPTGRAGRGEDSLYAEDVGPYCVDCWYELPHKLAAEIERLRMFLTAISSPTQTSDLLWWQRAARDALSPRTEGG